MDAGNMVATCYAVGAVGPGRAPGPRVSSPCAGPANESVPGRMECSSQVTRELFVRHPFCVETAPFATMVCLPFDLGALPPTRPHNGQEGLIRHLSRPDRPRLAFT